LKGDVNLIRLCKGNHEFKFDSVMRTWGGALYCARFFRHSTPPPQEYNMASVVQVWKQKKPLRRSSKSMSSKPMSILDT
jgi:hypothetical protein